MNTSNNPAAVDINLFTSVRSTLAGNVWPVIPGPGSAAMLAILAQLEFSQWIEPASLLEMQLRQMKGVVEHAVKQVPFYSNRLDITLTEKSSIDIETFKSVPLLIRADVQQYGDKLRAQTLPSKDHSPLNRIQTSGSTGMPIVAYGTAMTRLFWQAFSLRDHLWHRRDMRKKIVAIRPEIGADKPVVEFTNWGRFMDSIYVTGPSAVLNSSIPIEEQAAWLGAQQAAYVLSLPTNIKELVKYFAVNNLSMPALEEIRTYGEVADPDVYELVSREWKVPVHDMYSCQEAGYIALQCHEYGRYHIQSENLLVEILNEKGEWCSPGEMGRVVITTLHNFAMPLIRYAVGDYAEAGEPCPCGRGLPVINRIYGRERNMVTLPGGGKHYPSFPSDAWAHLAPIRQIQLVQKSLEHIEARLAMDREMNESERDAFIKVIQERMKHPFRITISYYDRIERSKGGKFEDFISEIKSAE